MTTLQERLAALRSSPNALNIGAEIGAMDQPKSSVTGTVTTAGSRQTGTNNSTTGGKQTYNSGTAQYGNMLMKQTPLERFQAGQTKSSVAGTGNTAAKPFTMLGTGSKQTVGQTTSSAADTGSSATGNGSSFGGGRTSFGGGRTGGSFGGSRENTVEYSTEDLWRDMVDLEPAATAKRKELETAIARLETAERLAGRWPMGESWWSEYLDAYANAAKVYGEYESARDSYNNAITAYNKHMENQQDRRVEEINGELEVLREQLNDQYWAKNGAFFTGNNFAGKKEDYEETKARIIALELELDALLPEETDDRSSFQKAFEGAEMIPEGYTWADFGKEMGYHGERALAALLGSGEAVTDFTGANLYRILETVTSLGGLAPNTGSEWNKAAAESFLNNSVTEDYEESIRLRYDPSVQLESQSGIVQGLVDVLTTVAGGKLVAKLLGGLGIGAGGLDKADDAAKAASNASKAILGAKAAGGAANEAYSEGASLDQALNYSAASGTVEVLIESIAGGIPGLGSGKIAEVARKVMDDPVAGKMLDIMGEGGEEGLSAFLGPIIKRAVYDPDAELADPEEIAERVILGIATSLALQSAELPGLFEDAGSIPTRWSQADEDAFQKGVEDDFGVSPEEFAVSKGAYPHFSMMVETPGEMGELAVPYSERGIQIEERLINYQKDLKADSDYIVGNVGEFKRPDLAILTTETGVEYTMLTIGGKAYLVRGAAKSTTIPQSLIDELIKNHGTLDCHSHPFIGDLIPSKGDMNTLKLLPWQESSVIIEPTQRTMRFNSMGAIGEETNSGHDETYYDFMLW